MNNDLSLSLELLEQSGAHFQFRLTVRSRAAYKLFLPFPDITGLRFSSSLDRREAEWLTSLLVSAAGGGFTLEPGALRAFEWRVRPCDMDRPRLGHHTDYYRWCVDVPPGEYQVAYHFKVGPDYFDPDSHMRLPGLERAAEAEKATVWLGHVESNSVAVIRDLARFTGGAQRRPGK